MENRGAGSAERSSVDSITTLRQARNSPPPEIITTHAALGKRDLFNQTIALVDIIAIAHLDFKLFL